MFLVFLLLVLPFWTSAKSYNGDRNVQKQMQALQNTVNELKDLVRVQNHRNDRLELELLKSRNEMGRLKENYLNEIEILNSRVSKLEVIEAKCNRVLTTLKKDNTTFQRYVNPLNFRLSRLEKMLTAMMEDPQELRNISEAKEKSVDRGVGRIQKRILIPPPTSQDGVAFYAYMSSILLSPSTEHVLVFDVVKTNIGNAYHPSIGVFMVPESGVYVFTWTFRMGGNHNHGIQLMVNREYVGSVYLHTTDGVETEATGIAVTHVDAGDDVFVRTHSSLQIGTNHYIQSNIFGRSSFAGWKIF